MGKLDEWVREDNCYSELASIIKDAGYVVRVRAHEKEPYFIYTLAGDFADCYLENGYLQLGVNYKQFGNYQLSGLSFIYPATEYTVGEIVTFLKSLAVLPDHNSLQGMKYDDNKPRWGLMPRGVLTQVVQVLTYGAKKYSDDNWMKVEPPRYYDALMRHVDAWRNGEKLDEESGCHHLAHAACCVLFLLWFERRDDGK